jgi:hypothetical protein
MITIGIIREGKNPPDKRVSLTPTHCSQLLKKYTNLQIVVQPSMVRAFADTEYSAVGIELNEDLSGCDIILGVKEVPVDMLIPGKNYMFFSHTIKKQPYNQKLLQAILEKKISLVDYELLTDEKGTRLLGFGKYAGIVGCYNAFRGWGLKYGIYNLKPAHQCADRFEAEQELNKVTLPGNFKMVMTGGGRVASGALEILEKIKIRKVSPQEYLNKFFDEPIYTQLSAKDYVRLRSGEPFTTSDFYKNPGNFVSDFFQYAMQSDMYVPCHFWDPAAPVIFTREDALHDRFRIRLVADISCDVNGPIASTIRASTIANPFYGYDPDTDLETEFYDRDTIGVMAIDNLPCELPKDASEYFGAELMANILPEILEKPYSEIIERARETDFAGNLTPRFHYLSEYALGKLV